MKAIILAAGEWSRLRPLTNTTPKPLIKIMGKTILEHNLESIYKHVEEIIIITKYKAELFPEILWEDYKWTPITYKIQWDKKGTGWALKWLSPDLDTLILNWDSIFDSKDLEAIIQFNWYGALVQQVENPEKYGIYSVDEDNNVHKIVEKPSQHIWNLAGLWVYKVNSKFFELNEATELSPRWEYELTCTLGNFIKLFPFKALEIWWAFLDISYSWDILKANSYLLSQLKSSEIKWTIEDGVTIKWNIILEEWAILKSGTYIEWNVYIWKDTSIGPNTYLRGETVIWDHCKIWNAVEVKNSNMWDKVNIAHLSYIGDSILGNNINIGWWFITANLRHDNWNIKALVKWELVDTGKRKLWVIIWDNVKTGISANTMPGRTVESGTMILPGQIIK